MRKMTMMLMLSVVVLLVAATAQAAYITGVTATASNTEGGFGAFNVVNGSGFNETAGTHTNAYNGGPQVGNIYANWRTGGMVDEAGIATVWIKFDLGAAYDLTSMQIWNMNRGVNPDLTEHGIAQMDVEVSLNGTDWTEVLTDQTLTEAPGLSTYTGETVALSATNIRYVRFQVDSAFGRGGLTGSVGFQAGLSEVRFVPEPATMSLLGIGGLLALVRRRRK